MYGIASQELVREHREVEKLLDRLETLLAQGPPNEQELQQTFALIRTDLDLHLRKEEDVYFPALERFLPKEAGPIAVMLYEHEMLEHALRVFPQQAVEFIRLLRAHIQKEDNILFVIADRNLTGEEQQEILARMRQVSSAAPAG